MQQVWGVDIGTRQVAFGFWPAREVYTVRFGDWAATVRLAVAYRAVADMAPLLAENRPPLCVWVEQPAGKYVKPTLLHMVGVVQLAVHHALCELYPHPVTVYPVGVGSWKKHAVGSGRATKAEVMAWARAECPEVGSQDEADALGVAAAGAKMLDRFSSGVAA